MGWYFRKCESYGSFCFAFSKSGIGVSTGIKIFCVLADLKDKCLNLISKSL